MRLTALLKWSTVQLTAFIATPGMLLCMYSANERQRYTVTLSLIGWVHTLMNDPATLCAYRAVRPWWAFQYHINRVHSVYASSQWETMLHCNIISLWLGAYTKWPLHKMLYPKNLQSFEGMRSVFTVFQLFWNLACISAVLHLPYGMLNFVAHYHTWWRHQMETLSEQLALCAGNSPVPVNSPHKGQWRGALMFSLICVWINGWVNNREVGDLRRHRGHYDVIVMNRQPEAYPWRWDLKSFCKLKIRLMIFLRHWNIAALTKRLTKQSGIIKISASTLCKLSTMSDRSVLHTLGLYSLKSGIGITIINLRQWRLSQIYNANPYTNKTVFLVNRGPGVLCDIIMSCCMQYNVILDHVIMEPDCIRTVQILGDDSKSGYHLIWMGISTGFNSNSGIHGNSQPAR